MRPLARVFVLSGLLAVANAPAGWAEAALSASRTGVTLAMNDVTASVRGSVGAGLEKTALDVATESMRARVFRNAGVLNEFTASRLRVGIATRSPYIAALGVGDGGSARFRTGRYAVTGAYLSTPAAQSVAAELSALDGRIAIQFGRMETRQQLGSTSFGGAQIDFDALGAEISVRWHVGREEVEDGSRATSAGGVAIGLPSLLEDGDRLHAAMSRPIRGDALIEAPDVSLSYAVPVAIGRMACEGGYETAVGNSRVRLSWGMTW